jgi:hypothetical protein
MEKPVYVFIKKSTLKLKIKFIARSNEILGWEDVENRQWLGFFKV